MSKKTRGQAQGKEYHAVADGTLKLLIGKAVLVSRGFLDNHGNGTDRSAVDSRSRDGSGSVAVSGANPELAQ